jgi:ribosomal 30S subunit maturation factor RimM
VCSGDSRGLITGDDLFIVAGTFTKVLKRDGTMFFRPCLTDSSFILEAECLYHEDFRTEWKITSSTSTAKGFHIKFADVNDSHEATHLIGERFGLYESQIAEKSIDILIGKKIFLKDGAVFGTILSISKTPSYFLLEVTLPSGSGEYIPFTDEFVIKTNGRYLLLRGGLT